MSEIDFENAMDIVLKYHHEQAEVVFQSDNDESRQAAFVRTETLREVAKRFVRDNELLSKEEKAQYTRKMKKMYTAFYASIFFKNSIMEENPNG